MSEDGSPAEYAVIAIIRSRGLRNAKLSVVDKPTLAAGESEKTANDIRVIHYALDLIKHRNGSSTSTWTNQGCHRA